MKMTGTVTGVTTNPDDGNTVLVTVYVDDFDAHRTFVVDPDTAKKWPFGKAIVFKGQGAPRAK